MAEVKLAISPFDELEIYEYRLKCSKGIIPGFTSSHEARSATFLRNVYKDYIAKRVGFDSYKQLDALIKSSPDDKQTLIKIWKQILDIKGSNEVDSLIDTIATNDTLLSSSIIDVQFESDYSCTITVRPNASITISNEDTKDVTDYLKESITKFVQEFADYLESLCNDEGLNDYCNKTRLYGHEITINIFSLKDMTTADGVFLISIIEWPDNVVNFIEFINRFPSKLSDVNMNNVAKQFEALRDYANYVDPVKIWAKDKYSIDLVDRYGHILVDGYEVLELKVNSPDGFKKFFDEYVQLAQFIWNSIASNDVEEVDLSIYNVLSY